MSTSVGAEGVKTKDEIVWRGVAVSNGIAVGRVLRLHTSARYIMRASLESNEIAPEIKRLKTAVRLARRQLLNVKRNAERTLGEDHAYIFDAHILMLEDRRLLEEIEDCIRSERVNAEWAVKVVTDRLLAAYAQIKDEYLRARHTDIEDVTRRLLVALKDARREPSSDNRKVKSERAHERSLIKPSGDFSRRLRMIPDAVIVAEELLPSAVAELDLTRVRAFVTDIGGWTSHTAIIARGLGIPAVVGLRDFYARARTGEPIVVDAQAGEVFLRPAPETVARYRNQIQEIGSARTAARTIESESEVKSGRTREGVEILLRANVELPAEYEGVRRFGAQGIGLYRSEFLLTRSATLPGEDEQCEAYTEVARLGGAHGAKVRLFDLGGDKLSPLFEEFNKRARQKSLDPFEPDKCERNPALGLRAIRFCLRHDELMRTQARAAMRAAALVKSEGATLELVLPMISDVSEVRRARHIIEEERENLAREGREAAALKIGAMIEVPSAVALADKLAREVDFFSLGTNDLVQYMLAVDRGSDAVADWFRTLHPAVLHAIRQTLDAACRAQIPAIVCGEMAGTPAYAFVLVGLGARELSMTAPSLPRVRSMLAQIDAERARAVAEECLECATADESEEIVRRRLADEYAHVFPPEKLPAPKR